MSKMFSNKNIKIFIYGTLIFLLALLNYLPKNRFMILKLKWGTPEQKEYVLNYFRGNHPRYLVPAVIKAILDDTGLPMHGDTGWGSVNHMASIAMSDYARQIDGKTLYARGEDEYSFARNGGSANLERRREVYNNWKKWWENNNK